MTDRVSIPTQTYQQTLEYLSHQPFREVAPLINSLHGEVAPVKAPEPAPPPAEKPAPATEESTND